jgi:multidrug efflux pump subunit AcrA (membrane-fusion protein)
VTGVVSSPRSGSANDADESARDKVAVDRGYPDDPVKGFLAALLAMESALGPADAAVVFVCKDGEPVEPVIAHPDPSVRKVPQSWLKSAAEISSQSVQTQRSIVAPWTDPTDLYDTSVSRYVFSSPLKLGRLSSHTVAFLTRPTDKKTAQSICGRLELGISLLRAAGTVGMVEKVHDDGPDMRLLREAMETLAAVNLYRRFHSAAMALCNEVAAKWHCERVGVGFLKGPCIHIKALSHTENFSRKMQIVQNIETAMEECLDQDCEVVYPALPDSGYVARAAAELAKVHGPLAVLSLPVRRGDEVSGVLSLTRPADQPFEIEEIEGVRLALELCSVRLLDLREQDRWIGAKIAAGARKSLAVILGPRHTWAKAAAIVVSGIILFLIFAQGQYRAEAMFALEATERQIVPAPFDGYIKAVNVEVGDTIVAGETSLAELDTVELRLQLAAVAAEKAGYVKQAAAAMRDDEAALVQIAQANADKAQAQIDLIDYMISQARIISPSDGTVVQGDLKRQIGAPVKTGDLLFEVTPLDSLRAVLNVPEDQITDVRVGLEGFLATASYPAERITFEVERIDPVAKVINQRNVFEVRVKLIEIHKWMRPGMEGVGKITIGKRPYAWIWTRKIVNWFRMKMWF